MKLVTRRVMLAIVATLISVWGTTNVSEGQQDSQKRIQLPVYRVAQPETLVRQDQQPFATSTIASNTGSQQGYQDSAIPNQYPAQDRPNQQIGFNQPLTNAQVMEAIIRAAAENEDSHPLDPAIQIAHRGLENIRSNIHDYTCYMVKRERINGRLTPKETLYFKIRNEREFADGSSTPFSIYMRVVEPRNVRGREAIWVSGWNDNKLVGHDVGWRSIIRANLDPEGHMAMRGNRYPIWEAGLENLVEKLISKAERDRRAGDCQVEFFTGANISGRECTMIQVTHQVEREPYDFHIAQVYIDNELQVPIRYAAYSWPTADGGSPILEEEYTYLDVQVNVGLTDEDFDPDNPDYDYP